MLDRIGRIGIFWNGISVDMVLNMTGNPHPWRGVIMPGDLPDPRDPSLHSADMSTLSK